MSRTVAGRYQLDDLPAGRGGMGEVWLGRDVRLDRPVAVKFVRFPDGDSDDELVRRFVRESRITAALEHPGVPAVYDVGTEDGTPYMVMQRVPGITVADLVAEHGSLPLGWAVGIAAQVCAVLAAAHRASLIHRDLKPGNLMLGPDGVVRVLDFGLAVALASGDSQITRSGEALGTPAYMAPELVMAGRTDSRTDLYALGCTLHEMLTGERPFRGETAYSVMHQQVDGRIPDVRSRRPEVPADLAAQVRALLAKSPDDRPASATDVFAVLAPYVGDLAALPGAVDRSVGDSPVRMQATILARVAPERVSPAPSAPPAPPPGSPEQGSGGRSGLRAARGQAESHAAGSRPRQAAEVLSAALPSADRVLGTADPDVVSARGLLADLLFDAGDFRRAGQVYDVLVTGLASVAESADHRRWRTQHATCLALIGETTSALAGLEELLAEETAERGAHDEQVLDLRRQIGLLQLGRGDTRSATETFTALLTDLTTVHGPDHGETARVRDLCRTVAEAAG